jgi:hypothetical protein
MMPSFPSFLLDTSHYKLCAFTAEAQIFSDIEYLSRLFFTYRACYANPTLIAVNAGFTMLILLPKLAMFSKKRKHIRFVYTACIVAAHLFSTLYWYV